MRNDITIIEYIKAILDDKVYINVTPSMVVFNLEPGLQRYCTDIHYIHNNVISILEFRNVGRYEYENNILKFYDLHTEECIEFPEDKAPPDVVFNFDLLNDSQSIYLRDKVLECMSILKSKEYEFEERMMSDLRKLSNIK